MSPTRTTTNAAAPPADVENVTDADVQRAEQEAAEAVALVDALEKRVVDGDETVTHDQIENARSLGRFAKLRAQATARKAEKARAAARLRTLEQLAEQMRARHSDAGQIIDLMLQIEAATKALIELCNQRSADITAWRQVMLTHDVPPVGAETPAAGHGRVGWRTHTDELVVDDRQIAHVKAGQFVAEALHRVIRATGDPLTAGGTSIAAGLPYADAETPTDSDAYRARLEKSL